MNTGSPENKVDCCDDCEMTAGYLRALQDTLYVIGGKWRVQVLYSVYLGNRRFREIERSIPGITTRMLSRELKEMELNKLVTRTVCPGSPVRIEYTPTGYSESLIHVVQAMIEWGMEHREMIKK